MFLEYDKTKPFPTAAKVECNWGDETLLSEELDSLAEEGDDASKLRYKLTHSYSTNGIYNLTCR